MSINRVIMVGFLARDPEMKEVRASLWVCKFTIATNHIRRSKDGKEEKEVCFIDCSVWNKEAELCAKWLKKGSPISVSGRLKLEKWQDKNGQERSRHVIAVDEVMFLEKMKDTNPIIEIPQQQPKINQQHPARSTPTMHQEEFGDDLPF